MSGISVAIRTILKFYKCARKKRTNQLTFIYLLKNAKSVLTQIDHIEIEAQTGVFGLFKKISTETLAAKILNIVLLIILCSFFAFV